MDQLLFATLIGFVAGLVASRWVVPPLTDTWEGVLSRITRWAHRHRVSASHGR